MNDDEPMGVVVSCPECGRIMWAGSSHWNHGPKPVQEMPAPTPEADTSYKDKSDERRRRRM